MSENKFYIPIKDPFDNKRGKLFNRDIRVILKDNVERLILNKTTVDPKCNNFLICNYLDIDEFLFRKNIPLNKNLKEFCKKNNIKIVVGFSREVLHPERRHNSDDWFWLFNADNFIEYQCHGGAKYYGFSFFDHAYAFNKFDYAHKFYPACVADKFSGKDTIEKTKKFSIVLGTLNKGSRVWWCVKLIHDNLINDPNIVFSKIAVPNPNELGDERRIERPIDWWYTNVFKRDEHHLLEILKENMSYMLEHTFVEKDMDLNKLYHLGAEWIVPDEVKSTLINIVFETRPHDWAYGSLTEKTWKPIIEGIPFIWVAFKNTKPYLESKGYKFYSFIDYTYDSIERESLRYRAVYEEFKRLNAFSLDELKAMVDNEQHITQHNKEVFYHTDYDKRFIDVFSAVK
jgi:hypothetical protein|tara:strand:- start:67 stop:1266 length:1200 start_codon:yes stop_codon:yes gene_type:complete